MNGWVKRKDVVTPYNGMDYDISAVKVNEDGSFFRPSQAPVDQRRPFTWKDKPVVKNILPRNT